MTRRTRARDRWVLDDDLHNWQEVGGYGDDHQVREAVVGLARDDADQPMGSESLSWRDA